MGAAAGGAAPFYRSPSGDVTLYQGDALAVLRALPAGSVHTVITSPPYFALRDYQTGTWEGGDDPACEHLGAPKRTQAGFNERYFGKEFAEDKQGELRQPYRAVCGACGARRVDAQLGLEDSPDEYVAALVAVFREVKRVLHPTGTVWCNIGDGYGNERSWGGKSGAKNAGSDAGGYPRHKVGPGLGNKQLLMMPARVAIALQADGWWLRAMIPWLKRNAMPESATDRPTTATEYVFLLAKSERYFYDADAVRVPHDDKTHPGLGLGGSRMNHRQYTAWEDAPEGVRRMRVSGEREYHPAGRNRRNADWWFDSLRAILAGATGLLADEDGAPLALPVNPAAYPGAHFATFAPKLVEPMILASTSAKGCCGKCGAPYTRVVERGALVPDAPGHKPRGALAPDGFVKRALHPAGVEQGHPNHHYEYRTTGWRAGCACGHEPVACVALDPFCGSGTVGVVARKHGRHFIGVDLSAAYLEMARERLGQLALPLMTGG